MVLNQAGLHRRPESINPRTNKRAQLTSVINASVFVVQTDFRLLLLDDGPVLRPQASRMARENEGVAVQTSAVNVHLSAGVVDGVVVVVGVNHPVLIV